MSDPLPPEDRERVELLFERAAELAPEERPAFLAGECGANSALRAKLEWLLNGLEGEDRLGGAPLVLHSRVGTTIGPYTLLEKIGEGGMGEVYAAEQREPVHRRVALKVIKPGMDSAQVIARFEAERQALARMAHPNIAQVFDAGATDEGRPFFVMELVPGDPVTEYCDRFKLSTRDRLELFVSLCDGVQHAHQKGVIHRDLKPSNLLVMRQDGRAVPKIIDFGVARATTGRLAERTLFTMVGQVVGTLDYMSPEQADPTGLDIDTRSDIYSLGVVLYQLASGLLPFDHASTAAQLSDIQRTIREVDPPTPSTRLRGQKETATAVASLHGTDERALVRQLSGDLDWICLKALDKDPARRYASASELADDVRRHLTHEPVLAGRPGALYRMRKFVRRNRVGVAAAALVLGAGMVGVAGVVWGKAEARARGEEVLRLSALQELDDLVEEADDLWPIDHALDERYATWLARADALAAELPDHEATLAGLREKALADSVSRQESTGTLTFRDDEDRWWYSQLSKLVERLREFTDPATGLAGSGISSEHGFGVRRRREAAADLEGTLANPVVAAAWRDAAARIRASERYANLELTPQLGLVPIGLDPVSGLEEFAHPLTGRVPERDDAHELVIAEDTSLVFVLLPGGSFRMGAQRDTSGFNYDPNARQEEGPVHRVTVSPFFLSKYEFTQGQWLRFSGSNPSKLQPGRNVLNETSLGLPLDLSHPVDSVSWITSTELCARLGLTLPSEAQWEYAARAGTSWAWPTGPEVASLSGSANVRDRAFEDGSAGHARVGSYAANGFGLCDMIGNVWEWCIDGFDREFYMSSPELDPVCELPATESHMLRGGGFSEPAFRARVAHRREARVELGAGAGIGLRPARSIQSSASAR